MLKVVKDILLIKIECASEVKGFQEDFRWLSNFFGMEPFLYDDISFKNVECFYQAMKTLDKKERAYISTLEPGKAKRYVSPANKKFVIREDWDEIKLSVMEYGLRIKFNQQDFKDLLLASRDIYIEETNGWGDVFWGCNTSGDGLNNLGKIIQKIRKELQENKNIMEFKPTRLITKKKNKSPVIVVNKRIEKCDVYIGRGSLLGNPYSIHTGEFTSEDSMRMYEYDFFRKLNSDKEFKLYILNLEGNSLGCFCKKHSSDSQFFPLDTTICHGEIIANFINTTNEIV